MLTELQEEAASPGSAADARQRYEEDQRATRRKTAAALMIAARLATDADDFVNLADCLSEIELTEDQRRRLYEVMRPPPDDPQARLDGFWKHCDAIIDHRERETEAVIRTALELAVQVYGQNGAVFSVNILGPLVSPRHAPLAGLVIRSMARNSKIEPVGEEKGMLPGHKGGRVRTYKLTP